jgi:hypothetical protein
VEGDVVDTALVSGEPVEGGVGTGVGVYVGAGVGRGGGNVNVHTAPMGT